MKTIQMTKRIKGLALLGLGVGLLMPESAWAQPDPNAPAMAQNPANRARRAKGQKGMNGQNPKAQARMQEREMATAEAIAGKPLTDEQKQKVRESLAAREEAVREAREKYITEMAASLGMEPDAVRLKMREANARRNAAGGVAGAGNGMGKGAGRRGARRNRGGQAGQEAQGEAAPAAGG